MRWLLLLPVGTGYLGTAWALALKDPEILEPGRDSKGLLFSSVLVTENLPSTSVKWPTVAVWTGPCHLPDSFMRCNRHSGFSREQFPENHTCLLMLLWLCLRALPALGPCPGRASGGRLQSWRPSEVAPLSLLPKQEGTCRFPAGLFDLGRNRPVHRVRPLSLQGRCVSEPCLRGNGIVLVSCQQQLFMYQPVPIASHPSCLHWLQVGVLVPHHHCPLGIPSLLLRPLHTYSLLHGHLHTPLGIHALAGPLCPTILLASVGISLEMRQLSRRQEAGRELKPRLQGWEKTRPGRRTGQGSRVPSAQGWAGRAPGCCGHMWWGASHPGGCSFSVPWGIWFPAACCPGYPGRRRPPQGSSQPWVGLRMMQARS